MTASIAKGQVLALGAVARDEAGVALPGKTILFESANPAVAVVDKEGKVTGMSSGSASIRIAVDAATNSVTVSVVAFKIVQPGMRNTCAISTSGALYCAGSDYGTLAHKVDGARDYSSLTSQSEPEPSPVAHFCALDSAGGALCWGSNSRGQLGVGDLVDRKNPSAVSDAIVFKMIAAGQHHTCGVSTQLEVYCWGDNKGGQLGTSSVQIATTPLRVAGIPAVHDLAVGNFQTCSLTLSGETWCWGRNEVGQLGQGVITDKSEAPLRVAGAPAFRSIASKWNWTCGLTSTGNAWCWGDNTLGQLGVKSNVTCEGTGKHCLAAPTPVETSLVFSSLAMSQFSTCGLSEAKIFCWGGDMQRQFGATSQPQTCGVSGFDFGCTSTATAGPSNFAVIAGSPRTYCGISVKGIAYCWGGNGMKQIGNPVVGAYSAVPVVFSIDPDTP